MVFDCGDGTVGVFGELAFGLGLLLHLIVVKFVDLAQEFFGFLKLSSEPCFFVNRNVPLRATAGFWLLVSGVFPVLFRVCGPVAKDEAALLLKVGGPDVNVAIEGATGY